jgi:hypothetical protein
VSKRKRLLRLVKEHLLYVPSCSRLRKHIEVPTLALLFPAVLTTNVNPHNDISAGDANVAVTNFSRRAAAMQTKNQCGWHVLSMPNEIFRLGRRRWWRQDRCFPETL